MFEAPGGGRRGADIAVLISYSGDGGVERMVNALIGGFVEAGYRVDVLVLKRRGGHYAALPEGARVLPLGPRHAGLAVPALAQYLRRVRPGVLLAAKDRAGRAAVRARRRAGVATAVVIRIGNTLSQSLAGRGALRRWLRYLLVRRSYPAADAIIAVSEGVADDIVATSGIARDRVHVVRNPVITPTIDRQAREDPKHPWVGGDVPLVLAVGRLTRQKDFATLLRAFARVREQRSVRLVILGEGEDRAELERLVDRLGLGEAVALPGFVANPYAWMARANLLVLSSAWEGSPNVLTEALHLGTPVVATDCRSGPRELLADGRYGSLVPVGAAAAMAAAIVATLDDPLPATTLRAAVAEYTRERSTQGYLQVLNRLTSTGPAT